MELIYCNSCGCVFIKNLIIRHYHAKRANGEYMCPTCKYSGSERQVFKDIAKIIEMEDETF